MQWIRDGVNQKKQLIIIIIIKLQLLKLKKNKKKQTRMSFPSYLQKRTKKKQRAQTISHPRRHSPLIGFSK